MTSAERDSLDKVEKRVGKTLKNILIWYGCDPEAEYWGTRIRREVWIGN